MKELKFDKSLIQDLTKMIDDNNVLAKSFRRVRDFVNYDVHSDFGLRLFRHRFKDPRVYNTPTNDEVAALIVGDMTNMDVGRDIIVKIFLDNCLGCMRHIQPSSHYSIL